MDLVEVAKRASAQGEGLMQKSGAMRKVVRWAVVYVAIWNGDGYQSNHYP